MFCMLYMSYMMYMRCIELYNDDFDILMDVDFCEEFFLYYLMFFMFPLKYNCIATLTQGEFYPLQSCIN